MFYIDADFIIPFENVAYAQFVPNKNQAIVYLKIGGEVELRGDEQITNFVQGMYEYAKHVTVPVYTCQ